MALTDYLSTTSEQIVNPLVQLWNVFAQTVPALIAAIIVAIIGYVVGAIIGTVTERILVKVGLDRKLKQTGTAEAIGSTSLSAIFGAVVKWYVFVVFLAPAVSLVQLGPLTNLLETFVLWIPSLLIGIVIVVLGLLVADFLYDRIKKPRDPWFKMLARTVKVVVIFAAFVIALNQIGVNVAIAENTFLIFVAGITTALSIALGLCFGYGFKSHAKKIIDGIMKTLK